MRETFSPLNPTRIFSQAVNIMECVLRKFGTYENFEEVTGGNVLPKSRVWVTVRKYLQKEGCVGEVHVFVIHIFSAYLRDFLHPQHSFRHGVWYYFLGGGVSVWWAPVSGRDDGGELQANFNHKPVRSTAALAGRDAETRDRYDKTHFYLFPLVLIDF